MELEWIFVFWHLGRGPKIRRNTQFPPLPKETFPDSSQPSLTDFRLCCLLPPPQASTIHRNREPLETILHQWNSQSPCGCSPSSRGWSSASGEAAASSCTTRLPSESTHTANAAMPRQNHFQTLKPRNKGRQWSRTRALHRSYIWDVISFAHVTCGTDLSLHSCSACLGTLLPARGTGD